MGDHALRVFDRCARTALQVLLGYFVAANTIGGVDWKTAALATGLAVVVALLQGVVDLPSIDTMGPWGDVVGRALRTFAQTALGTVGAAVLITEVPWETALGASALAAVVSVATSVVAMPFGPPEVRGTPALS